MLRMSSAVFMAQEMEARLGACEVLLRSMPKSRPR